MKLINLFLSSILFFIPSFFSAQSALTTKLYHLEAVFSGGQKNNLAKDKAELRFDLKQKKAVCDLHCTKAIYKYEIQKNKITFQNITPTVKPCPDGLLGIEEDFKYDFSK